MAIDGRDKPLELTALDRGGRHVDVRTRGALGTADDTATIVAALEAASSAGVYVAFLPAGTYLVTEVPRKTGITLEGAGRNTVIKQVANTSDGGSAKHLLTLDSVDVHYTVLRNLTLDGDKASQTTANHGVFLAHSGGTWETNDQWHLFENIAIRNCKGSGLVRGPAVREARILNVHAYQNAEYGFATTVAGGTDNWLINCTAEANGLSGFDVSGWGDRYVACKAFGNGQASVSGNQAGFLVTGRGVTMAACQAEENAGRGFHFSGGNCTEFVGTSLVADSNGEENYLLDGCTNCYIQGISTSYAEHAFQSLWAFRITSGTDNNIIALAVDPSAFVNGTFDDENINSNRITINSREIGRVFDSYGTVGASDDEHFAWGKEGAGASGNPYWTLKTSADAAPVASLQSYDGTTNRTYLRFDHANGRLTLGAPSDIEVRLDNHVLPTAHDTYDIGSADLRIRKIWVQEIDAVTGGGGGGGSGPPFNEHLTVSAGDTYDIGETATRWRWVYAQHLSLSGNAAVAGTVSATERVQSLFGSTAAAREHFRWGRTAAPSSGQPYYVAKTSDAASNPVGSIESWDGSTGRTYVRFDHGQGAIVLGAPASADVLADTHVLPTSHQNWDLGSSVLRWRWIYTQHLSLSGNAVISGTAAIGNRVQSIYGSGAQEHFRWGRTGSGVGGNPYYSLHIDGSAIGNLQGWDGTTAHVFVRMDHANARVILGVGGGLVATWVDGALHLPNIPTSNPGGSGQVWNDGGTLRIT